MLPGKTLESHGILEDVCDLLSDHADDAHDDSAASSASYGTEDEEYWAQVAESESNAEAANAAPQGDQRPSGQAAGQPDQPKQSATSGMHCLEPLHSYSCDVYVVALMPIPC